MTTLREYINQNNLSQVEFGELIGVSQPAVDRYIDGDRIPRPKIMEKISKVTGGEVTANDFYGLSKSKHKAKANSTNGKAKQ